MRSAIILEFEGPIIRTEYAPTAADGCPEHVPIVMVWRELLSNHAHRKIDIKARKALLFK